MVTAKPIKKKVVKEPKESKEKEVKKSVARYIFTVGRRKTAIAKVKFWAEGAGEFEINKRPWQNYFPTEQLQKIMTAPLELLGLLKSVNITALVLGGGVPSQAKAVALAISRALIVVDPARKTVLKKQGMMTRDSRKKERKKPGLKRARRAPQWQKR